MAQPLRLFTDGARNEETKVVGWGYVIVSGDIVLYAENGVCDGSATDGEYLAIIYGLLALPTPTRIRIVTDRDDVSDLLIDGHPGKKAKKRLRQRCKVMRQLFAADGISLSVIKSGKHLYNRYADTLARRACGLPSKSERRKQSKEKRLIKQAV